MKEEYDFTGAERGEFYVEDAVLIPPVLLAPDVLRYLTAHAEARGATLTDLVNGLLRGEIARTEAAE
jgi:hypothetical protein